jgi:hypothetical protein
VRQLQLTSYVHNAQALRMLVLVERNVEFLRDCITSVQIDTHRFSYLNVILIQSRERTLRLSCLVCRSERSSLRSFSEYRRVIEHFNEAYVNCKWRDYVSRCFVRDENDDVVVINERSLSSFSRITDDDNDRVIDHDDDEELNVQNVIVLF